jgi:hypothetical protein
VIFSCQDSLKILSALLICLVSTQTSAQGEGLLNLVGETDSGKVFLHLDTLPADYLYVAGLQSGVGSNDLGLDRGKLGRTRLVRFERYGNRVLLLEPNLKFRAETENDYEHRTVTEAFAQSVLAGFPIEISDEDEIRIDLGPLLFSDIMRIADLITDLEQGTFEVDPERSAVDLSGIRNFPQNSLVPVVVTLKGTSPGDFIKDVTPTPDSLTVRVTHQFIQVPESDYQTRRFHPRSGYFALKYRDYAAPLSEPMDKRLIYRHQLKPGDTLRYYVDNGTPEPVRSALLEGASWWSEAFAAAGLENGFTVDVLPDDADPLDVRYNVIQWVHRATRGWSYGFNVGDPRTGQIIKGHVSLGSQRVRQDKLIAEALTAPFTTPGAESSAASEMALARLRQLSAHEVGHTLGLDHNFAASFSGDASVMDYPHPNLYLDDSGRVRLDRAYERGISPWDKLTIRYGYSHFAPGQEASGLSAILSEANEQGIVFINHRDASLPGSAHPRAHTWDNGNNTLQRLDELLTIRQVGLQNFSAAVIAGGTPLFEMERSLVPVYLLHRYQLEATAKLLGGLYYDYSLKDDGPATLEPVNARTQKQALAAMVSLLRPERLALPENLRYVIPPPASGYDRDREFFSGLTGQTFDHLSPVRAGADLVIAELLQPQRLARMAEQHALNPELPGITDVLEALLDVSWNAKPPRDAYFEAIQAEVEWRLLRGLMAMSSNQSAGDIIRASATATLISLAGELQLRARKGDAHASASRHEILKFLDQQPADEQATPSTVPPGSPIG